MKGGHAEYQGNEVIDLLFDGEEFINLEANDSFKANARKWLYIRVCSYSWTCERLNGRAVQEAKRFISIAIEEPLNIGSGHGPTNHFAYKVNKTSVGK